MSLFSLAGLSCAVLCAILAAIAFIFGNSKIHRLLIYFNIAVVIWGLGCFIAGTATSEAIALFGWNFGHIGGVFLSVIFFQMVCELCEVKHVLLVIIGYFQAILFSLLILSNRFITHVRYAYGIYYNNADVLYVVGVAVYAFLVSASFYELTVFYRKAKDKKREQTFYIIVGFLVGFIGATSTFLPAFRIDVLYPFGNFGIVIYCTIISYAILRHQILNIEVIIKKTLIFAGLFTAVYIVFAFFALLGQMFFEKFITQNRWLSMIPSVIIVTLTLRPAEKFLIDITDKYLFQKKYDYKELLNVFASEVLTVLELGKLVELTEEKLTQIMKLEYCRMIIGDKMSDNLDAALKVPISVHGRTVGLLLLGRKKSDEEYNDDDIDILQSLAKTLGTAISNAKLVDELSKAQAEAAQKERMATVGTLAAGMAHEIRNPITTIRVFSEYVSDRLNDGAFRDKYKGTIAKEVGKIDHIIQTLIDFTGDDIKQASGVSAYEAVEELIAMISQSDDNFRRISFVNNVPRDLAKIRVNKEELDEIILNLTQNAVHAISGDGVITFSVKEAGETVIMEVSDTGCGMSEDTAKHIFDPFFTTRSKGFGLGLFVVKELVQRNNGKIAVESVINEGSIFKLEFEKII